MVNFSDVKTPGTKRPYIRDNLLMERSRTGPRLIIVCGLPASGKTTLARALASRLGAVRLSPDEWMDALSISLYDEEKRGKIEALQWKFGQELLALGLTVIIEWGTWGRSERDTLRLGGRALGAAVELHYLSAPVDVLFERIQRRGRENPPIQRDALSQWFEMFQAPTPEEMHSSTRLWSRTLLPTEAFGVATGYDKTGQSYCAMTLAKKVAPLLGPLVKEASWRVGSGMAMQSAAPPAGTATREMSNTESEGHCLSAASFVAFKLCTCATKAAEFTHRLVP